jgi:hypothetical protein
VTRADRSTVVFNDPRVSGDSLIGVVIGQPQRPRLSEATVLRAREPAPDRTAGLAFLGASGVLALAVYLVDKRPTLSFACHAMCPYTPNLDCCTG